MPDFLAWSYSRLKTFRTCPKQLYHTAVAKKWEPDYVPYVGSVAQSEGTAIDDALTARISTGTALPPQYQQWEPLMRTIAGADGAKFTQLQVAFDRTLRPSAYKDWERTWLRAAYDLAIVNGEHAFIWDWKNGRIWLDEDQLRLFAATAFMHWPEVEQVDTSYVWLKHGVTSDKTYRRRDLADMMATFLPDVERMQVSFKARDWPATPSKFGCAYCAVNALGKCSAALVPAKR